MTTLESWKRIPSPKEFDEEITRVKKEKKGGNSEVKGWRL